MRVERKRPPSEAASSTNRELPVQRSWVLMLVNLSFNVLPTPLTTAMMTTAMPAAIRPYSMAVAAELKENG